MIYAQESSGSVKKKALNEIKLPPAFTSGKMSLEEAVAKRKSVRKYASKELTVEQVSQILWAAYGASPRKGFISRNVPSAGGIFPSSVYMFDKNGIYLYQPLSHSLVLIRKGDFRSGLKDAALGQDFIKDAPICLLVTGNVPKCTERYDERATRYVAMEAGHIGQNVSLQAVALGLDTVMIGAFDDDAVSKIVSTPKEETPLYIFPIGYGAE